MQQTETSPQETMLRMFTAYWLPQALHTAAKLRVPDLLKDGPRTAAELARDTQTHEDSLRRVLRTLSSVGVFDETEDGRFGLTPLSQTIRSDKPDSLWGYLMLVDSEWFWRAWAQSPGEKCQAPSHANEHRRELGRARAPSPIGSLAAVGPCVQSRLQIWSKAGPTRTGRRATSRGGGGNRTRRSEPPMAPPR